jgi:hypothetical protein
LQVAENCIYALRNCHGPNLPVIISSFPLSDYEFNGLHYFSAGEFANMGVPVEICRMPACARRGVARPLALHELADGCSDFVLFWCVFHGSLFTFGFLLGESFCPCLFPDQPGEYIARRGGIAGAPALLAENKGSVAMDFKNDLWTDCAWSVAVIYPANPIWLAVAGLWPLACARLVRVSVVVASLVAWLVVVGWVDHGCSPVA